MSFLGGHRAVSLGELIFDAGAAGERRKKLCVWRFDAYDSAVGRRIGPFSHTNTAQWVHLLRGVESRIEQYAPELDFDEWESGPILADLASGGRILFGTKTKGELAQWFGKAAMEELIRSYGFWPRKVAARRVWLSKSGVQVAYEPVLDANGREVSCA